MINNVPYSGTEDLWWILYIKKRFQLVKKIRLTTHIDNFEEKKIQNFFFEVGQKKPKILIYQLDKFSENWNSDVFFEGF